jgi:cell division protein FtsB
MSDEYDLTSGSSEHPLVTKFKATIAEIRSNKSKSNPPTSMIREKREELRRRRLELEEQIEDLKDDEPSIDSIEDEVAAATA